jgi:hypothetical protein
MLRAKITHRASDSRTIGQVCQQVSSVGGGTVYAASNSGDDIARELPVRLLSKPMNIIAVCNAKH